MEAEPEPLTLATGVRDLLAHPSYPFCYPHTPHLRKHRPQGYIAYEHFKPWLRDEFQYRCVYCLVRERWNPSGAGNFSVDHYIPQVLAPERICDYENLLYACVRCNSLKADSHQVLDPCVVAFADHFAVGGSGVMTAKTTEGQDHVDVLALGRRDLTDYRRGIIQTLHRLADSGAYDVLSHWLRFPEDLPNLRSLRPPQGNARPDGLAESCFERRRQGMLPAAY